MKRQEGQQFYKLLRLSLGLTQEFPIDVDADGWRRLYQTAIRQSLVGVCYQGVCLLPEGSKPLAAFRDGVHRIAADASVRHE
jgi:hypothetical protein